ncbi:MAG: DinB family protein [Hyphomicrobiales bacterium]
MGRDAASGTGPGMIMPAYVRKLAGYNRWMNVNIYAACAGLDDSERKRDRGAFFGSIHATLNHILWADQIWMHRLAGMEKPLAPDIAGSVAQHDGFGELRQAREAMDERIVEWAEGLEPPALEGDLVWSSGATGRLMTRPRALLVTHMFNHQTHHRGQVHCLLTQCGVRPAGTDIAFMPE